MLKIFTQFDYEVHTIYGSKMCQTFKSKENALKVIEKQNEEAIKGGYLPTNYFVVLCNYTVVRDENGALVSESITRVRV